MADFSLKYIQCLILIFGNLHYLLAITNNGATKGNYIKNKLLAKKSMKSISSGAYEVFKEKKQSGKILELAMQTQSKRSMKQDKKVQIRRNKMLAEDMGQTYIQNIDERTEIAGDRKVKIQPSSMLDFDNAQYVIQISVGDKKDTYKVILDTGSTTNLLITSKCKSYGCNQHKKYYPQQYFYQSLIEKSDLYSNNITYGSGFVDFVPLKDTFWVENIEVKGQKFGGVVDEKIGKFLFI